MSKRIKLRRVRLRPHVGLKPIDCTRDGRITAARLKELLRYDPDTGHFYNRVQRIRALKGREAGHRDHAQNRVVIQIEGQMYGAHRLAWLYMTGEWPPPGMTVDHKNRNSADNRWTNLRLATPQQQQQNRGMHRRNTSGFKGVGVCKKSGKWIAGIGHNYRFYRLGAFDTPELAHAAYRAAAKLLHGEFARFA